MFTRNLAMFLVCGAALCACSDGSTSSSNGSSGDPGTVDAGSSSGTVSSSSGETSTSSSTSASSSSTSSGQVNSSSTSGNTSSGESSTSSSTSSSTGGTSGSSGQAMGTLAIYTVDPAGGEMYVNGELYASVSGNGTQPVPAGVAMSIEMHCGNPADRKLPLYQDNLMVNEGQTVNFLDRDSNNPIHYPKNICGGWQGSGGSSFTLTAVKTVASWEREYGLWKFQGLPSGDMIVDGSHLTTVLEDGTVLYTGEISQNNDAFTRQSAFGGEPDTFQWLNDGPCE